MAIFVLGQLTILAVLVLTLGLRRVPRTRHCCCHRD
jgi:hypothetical protein